MNPLNPATLLIQKLQLSDDASMSDDWKFVYCVLKVIAENDDRIFRDFFYTNWVDDCEARILESGVKEDTQSLLLFKQLTRDVREQLVSQQ